MAKSFKDFSSESALPKPLFERDFFDMTQDTNLPVRPLTPDAPAALPPGSSPAEATATPDAAADTQGRSASAGRTPKARKVTTPAAGHDEPGKQRNAGVPGNTPQPGIPPGPVTTTPAGGEQSASNQSVRQTFVLAKSCLERVRDYVHARRSQGDYFYSQRQLLEEAVDSFLASRTIAPPRPAELREKERQLRVRIQEGRQASTGPGRSAEQETGFPQVGDGQKE